jgi:hypothetical protein
MSISAINGGNSAWYTQAQTQSQPAQPDMSNTAQLFGISTSQLDQDLQSGDTLSSLASQDGVSSSSLISAIESDLQANAPQGAPAPSSSQLQGIATNIANGTAPVGGHRGGHHHHGMGMASELLDSSSDADTTTTQDSASQLAPGQALTSLLAAGAYAGSASDAASAASATSQVDQYI